METNRRSVAEEAAAKTREAMERARAGHSELEDRPPQMALPEHHPEKSFFQEHPMEAALGAISLGFLLTRFIPIGAILRGLLSLGWMIAKPLALIFAGWKLVELSRSETEKRLPD